MKKSLLLPPLLILSIAVVSNFAVTGNLLFSAETYQSPYPLSATVQIEEPGKQRTHQFTLYSDGQKTLLVGNFQIDEQVYPGRILYDGEQSYVFRPDPNQALVYEDPAQIIYGFLPVHSLDADGAEATLLETDRQGFPLKYSVLDKETGEKSIVTLKNAVHSPRAISGVEFSLPDGTAYRPTEGFLTVG